MSLKPEILKEIPSAYNNLKSGKPFDVNCGCNITRHGKMLKIKPCSLDCVNFKFIKSTVGAARRLVVDEV